MRSGKSQDQIVGGDDDAGYFHLIDRLSSWYLERSNGRASEPAYGHFELPIEPCYLVRTWVISKSVDASHLGTSTS